MRIIADIIGGLTGGFPAVLGTCFAYAASMSKAGTRRSYRMAAMEGAMGVGGTVGYLILGPCLR
jgi:hypothetical protein